MVTADDVAKARATLDDYEKAIARVYICVHYDMYGVGCPTIDSWHPPSYKEYPLDTDPYMMYQIGQQISADRYVKEIIREDRWLRNDNIYSSYYRIITTSRNPFIEEIRKVIREELNNKQHWWQ